VPVPVWTVDLEDVDREVSEELELEEEELSEEGRLSETDSTSSLSSRYDVELLLLESDEVEEPESELASDVDDASLLLLL
jgi:hypothetical protein